MAGLGRMVEVGDLVQTLSRSRVRVLAQSNDGAIWQTLRTERGAEQ